MTISVLPAPAPQETRVYIERIRYVQHLARQQRGRRGLPRWLQHKARMKPDMRQEAVDDF